jgi:hypothetical protein
LEEAIRTFAGDDKRAAATKLAALPASGVRDSVLFKTVDDWAKTDPEAAFTFAKNLPDAERMIAVTDNALRMWIQREPERAMKEVQALALTSRNAFRTIGLVASVAVALAKTDPARALQWVNELPEECRGTAPYVAIARTWAKTDPVAALEWCNANGIDPAVSQWTGGWSSMGIVSEAMGHHPVETLAWIESLPADKNREVLVERALASSSKYTYLKPKEAERLVALMTTLPPDAQARVAYQLGARAAGSIETVRVLTNRLPDPAVRDARNRRHGRNSIQRKSDHERRDHCKVCRRPGT